MEPKKLGFGCMRLPLTDQEDQASLDYPQICQMFDLFISKGFTYFDTAYMYHKYQSENILKKALVERYPRDKFTVTSKLPVFMLKTQEDQKRIFNEQMEKIGITYFDYYLLHAVRDKTYKIATDLKSFEFISQMKKEGKIRNIGFSFHDNPEVLDKILTEHPEVDYVQLQLNYIDWDNPSVQSGECYKVACRHHKKVIVMEPVKGGTLASIPDSGTALLKQEGFKGSPASLAIRFAASLENVFMVLSGMSNLQQVEDNVSYMEDFKPLEEKEKELISKMSKIIRTNIAIPCTGCRYCVEGCPKKILIPDLFALYNKYMHFSSLNSDIDQRFKQLTLDNGKPSDCIKCRHCEGICPQHLSVTDFLVKIKKEFE